MNAPLIHRYRSAAEGTVRPPLLLLLHGFGSNENDLFSLESAFPAEAAVASLRAPMTVRPGAFAWFPVEFTPQGPVIDALEAENSRQALKEFVPWAVEAFGADPARVTVAGFSQGGILSAALALTEPDLVNGAAVMSGRILAESLEAAAAPPALARLRWLIVHGTADATLDIGYARKARESLRALALEPEYQEFPMGHTVTDASLARVVRWVRTGWGLAQEPGVL